MIDDFVSPTYVLNKETVPFQNDLMSNFQFKTLFYRAWRRWSIFVRPTVTGFFFIRLTQDYHNDSRPLIRIAQDVVHLQESLDVPSVMNWLEAVRAHYPDQPDIFDAKKRSAESFLRWLGVGTHLSGNLKYFPVQWKLAIEVARLFAMSVGKEIHLQNQLPIKLDLETIKFLTPSYNTFVIHHIDELLAAPRLVGSSPNKNSPHAKIEINMNDIRRSPAIRTALSNLLDASTILKGVMPKNIDDGIYDLEETQIKFPQHRWSIVDAIINENLAVLNDELCLITPRTAIIFPSKQWRGHELVVSTIPGSTLRLKYSRFWKAIERMIEFVVEINSLGFVSERRSYHLLNIVANSFYESDNMSNIAPELYLAKKGRFSQLLSASAHLRRIAGLCQGLSNPTLWSSSDFSISLGRKLLEKFGIPLRLEHLERNIGNLAEYIDLYRAEIAEDEDRKFDLRSIGLAAASLTLTLLMLPSFYADTWQIALNLKNQYNVYLNVFVILGSILSFTLLVIAFYIAISSIKRQK